MCAVNLKLVTYTSTAKRKNNVTKSSADSTLGQLQNSKYHSIFICPSCKSTTVEIVMTDCTVSETVEFNESGDMEYGIPQIHESCNSHYQCTVCGWRLPIVPHEVDDDALTEWLEKQPYNLKHQTEV